MEALLACGIPNLELDDLVLESAFLSEKGGPNCRSQSVSAFCSCRVYLVHEVARTCRLLELLEIVLDKAQHNGRLADRALGGFSRQDKSASCD